MDNELTQLRNTVIELQQEVKFLRELYYKENFSDNQIFQKNITFRKNANFGEGGNVTVGTSTGTKIGTSSTQKLGFYGATPVVRQGSISTPSGGSTIDSQARSAINAIIATLQTLGLTA